MAAKKGNKYAKKSAKDRKTKLLGHFCDRATHRAFQNLAKERGISSSSLLGQLVKECLRQSEEAPKRAIPSDPGDSPTSAALKRAKELEEHKEEDLENNEPVFNGRKCEACGYGKFDDEWVPKTFPRKMKEQCSNCGAETVYVP